VTQGAGTVLGFLKSEVLHPADFTIREDGVVRLNPELARRVAALTAELDVLSGPLSFFNRQDGPLKVVTAALRFSV
jgi:hypothetical protein